MEHSFDFLRRNTRPSKPRTRGITEIRAPYYPPLGPVGFYLPGAQQGRRHR